MAMQERKCELPSDLPNLFLWEILPIVLLPINQRLHVTRFRILHGDVQTSSTCHCMRIPLALGLFWCNHDIVIDIAISIFLLSRPNKRLFCIFLESSAIQLPINEWIVELYDLRVFDFLHHFNFIDHVFVSLLRYCFVYFHFFQSYKALERLCRIFTLWLWVRKFPISFIYNAIGSLSQNAENLEVFQRSAGVGIWMLKLTLCHMLLRLLAHALWTHCACAIFIDRVNGAQLWFKLVDRIGNNPYLW